MKRKIAAIFAADIAGYSRLVAEDEEETLRRLASYRAVTDDFIAKAGGRIFNTAGDAVLAEFPSAVEAVRCAIDIQESLRTRNMAYPPSRQMSFRIGITIGDVVERDGDLLGDGVNIAARLEGLAEVGGICISRAVHEQVANKLSVQFSDIGAQEVKNIPTPVHAFMVAMRREDGTYATPQFKKPIKPVHPEIVEGVTATETEATSSVDPPTASRKPCPLPIASGSISAWLDARAVFPVRDDNGVVVGAWRMGLLRRADLAAAPGSRRAVSSSAPTTCSRRSFPKSSRCSKALNARADRGGVARGPSRRTRTWAQVDPPLRLGTAADPPLHALPAGLRGVSSAQLMLRELIERSVSAPELQGFGVGTDAIEGVRGASSRASTTRSRDWNRATCSSSRRPRPRSTRCSRSPARSLTEHGGAISHAAIAARELGIPAVVGVHDATRQIRDGERVRVDPEAGRVTRLDPAPPSASTDLATAARPAAAPAET